jgi:uncharacterized membrane protein YphA (DoxX/SURF4 family)
MQQTSSIPVPTWDQRLQKITIFIARLGLAYLFFTQLFWKLPPTFGCTGDFAYPIPAAENHWEGNGSGGLCYWIGLETIFADRYREVLVADMRPAGLPRIGVPITPLAQANAALIEGVIKPNIQVVGWFVWGAEAFIALSMLLGLFTRLGSLTAIAVSLQLYIGLANIPRPYEWEWSYGAMILLAIVLFGVAPGRFWGVDAWLRRRSAAAMAAGRWWARLLALAT